MKPKETPRSQNVKTTSVPANKPDNQSLLGSLLSGPSKSSLTKPQTTPKPQPQTQMGPPAVPTTATRPLTSGLSRLPESGPVTPRISHRGTIGPIQPRHSYSSYAPFSEPNSGPNSASETPFQRRSEPTSSKVSPSISPRSHSPTRPRKISGSAHLSAGQIEGLRQLEKLNEQFPQKINPTLQGQTPHVFPTIDNHQPNIGDFDERPLPQRKPLDQMTKEELIAYITITEEQNSLLAAEKEALSNTVNELMTVVQKLSEKKQKLSDEASHLRTEREIFVVQLNEALKLAGEGPALKKENDRLKKQLKTQADSNQQTINLNEEKIESMQAHVEKCTQQLAKSQEQLSKLSNEHEALKEAYSGTMLKISSFAEKEFQFLKQQKLIKSLDVPDPILAVHMLSNCQKEHYIWSCKSMDSKRDLLREALALRDPDTIGYVTRFLQFSLNDANFEALVMGNEEASTIFLQDLKKRDPEEYGRSCQKYSKVKEFATWKLEQALKMMNQNNRAKALQECLDFCQLHKDTCGSMVAELECHLIDAKLKPMF